MRALEYTGDDCVKFGDAWTESLGFSQVDDAGTAVAMTVPTRARLALYADRAKTDDPILEIDSQAGEITITAAGNGYTVAWSELVDFDPGTYYGDLRLEYAAAGPWTPADIVLEVVEDFTGDV